MTTTEPLAYAPGEILTFTGKIVSPLDLKLEDIDPIDIAHHLSNQCRYTGATRWHYSVAQHCVILHDYLARETEDVLLLSAILMHDSDEAYLLDLPAPLKHHPNGFGKVFIEAADKIQEKVAERFGLPYPEPAIVKEYDVRLRSNELDVLFPGYPHRDYGDPLPVTIHKWQPIEAKLQFIWRMANLGIVVRDGNSPFEWRAA